MAVSVGKYRDRCGFRLLRGRESLRTRCRADLERCRLCVSRHRLMCLRNALNTAVSNSLNGRCWPVSDSAAESRGAKPATGDMRLITAGRRDALVDFFRKSAVVLTAFLA